MKFEDELEPDQERWEPTRRQGIQLGCGLLAVGIVILIIEMIHAWT